jgi:hypothetical protein
VKTCRAGRTRGHHPSDEGAAKLIFLALKVLFARETRSLQEWHAKKQLALMFKERLPMASEKAPAHKIPHSLTSQAILRATAEGRSQAMGAGPLPALCAIRDKPEKRG